MADRFKGKQPVIVNLQGVDAELSRRIIDFASGVCYGGAGQMERITHQVYLLTPSDVEVSDAARRSLGATGIFRNASLMSVVPHSHSSSKPASAAIKSASRPSGR